MLHEDPSRQSRVFAPDAGAVLVQVHKTEEAARNDEGVPPTGGGGAPPAVGGGGRNGDGSHGADDAHVENVGNNGSELVALLQLHLVYRYAPYVCPALRRRSLSCTLRSPAMSVHV